MTETPNRRIRQSCVHQVQRYVLSHLDEPLHREVLAAIAGFSVPHLHRIFTEATGESLSSYVRRVRLERAGLKLRAGAIDITQIALAAGYSSHGTFGKAFKKQFGLSPDAFRELGCRKATAILKGELSHENQTD